MFIRKSKKSGKVYYELAETIWKNGAPRTRFVAYFGKKIPSSKELKEKYMSSIKRRKKIDLRAFEDILTIFKKYNSDQILTEEDLLRSRQEMWSNTFRKYGFRPFRTGVLDGKRQVYISLETGRIYNRKTRREASILIGNEVYDTKLFTQRLFRNALQQAPHQTLVEEPVAVSVEEFRRQQGI